MAFMEAISVAKAVEDEQSNLSLRPNQELIALGFANILGSLFQSYPTTGGFSRTAVNNQRCQHPYVIDYKRCNCGSYIIF